VPALFTRFQSILTGSTDGTAKIWDVRTGKNKRTFIHAGEIFDVAFSPNGTSIATGGTDHTIKIWDADKGHLLDTLKGHLDHVQALTFSFDGQRLASGGGDNTAKIWNAPLGEARGLLRGHSNSVGSVLFSPDGRTLLSASSDKTTKLWSVDEERQKISIPDSGTLTYSSQGSVVFSPRGNEVAMGGENSIRIWDLSTGLVRKTIDVAGWATLLSYSIDGGLLAFGHGGNNKVMVWDLKHESDVCSFSAHKTGPSYISFTKGERIVTSSLSENRVLAWDAETCTELSSYTGSTGAGYVTSADHNGEIRTLEVLNSRSLRLISIIDGEELASFSGHDGVLSDAKFSPNNKRLATSSRDGTIKLWDVMTGQELLTIKPGAGAIESIAFSPNGEVLAAGGGDGTIRLIRSEPIP
jgi:WD40 repeat protein